jgi:putative membrane protein
MFSGTWCGGMGPGGWAFMVVFWTAFLALAVWAVTRMFPARASTGPPGSDWPDQPTAAQILDRRLAAGEIDLDTYERLRRELSGSLR